jgi:hypothetical protein
MEPDWTHEQTFNLSMAGNRAITLWNAMLSASYRLLENTSPDSPAASAEYLTDILRLLADLYTGSKDVVSLHAIWADDIWLLFVQIRAWSHASRNSVDTATAQDLERAWDALSDAIKDNGGNNGDRNRV